MNQPPSLPAGRREYRKDIDGVRAIAVLSVVLFHAGVRWLGGGFVGVDVFFVISGYLIGAHLYEEVRSDRFRLAAFYQRRAKRILPALLLLLVFCYVVALVLLSPFELKRFGTFAVTTVFSCSNVYAWLRSGYFDGNANQNPLLMTWTLAVEEQFYIFFPLLMLALGWLGKKRRVSGEPLRRLFFWAIAIVAAISLVACLRATANTPNSAFYLIPYRAWELAAGVLMAVYEARPSPAIEKYGGHKLSNLRSVLGLGAILYAIFRYSSETLFPGPGALLPVVGAVLLLSAPQAWMNRRLLSLEPVRWIGLVSYSWYLWHWPLLSFASIATPGSLPLRPALALCALALGAAALSYRFVEQPMRSSRMAAGPLLRRYALASLLVAAPAALMVMQHGFPQRAPLVAAAEQMATMHSVECFGKSALVTSQTCMPAPDGRAAVALLGDSHAAALIPELSRLAADANLRFVAMVRFSCAPLMGVAPRSPSPTEEDECRRFTELAVQHAAGDPTIRTVVVAGRWAEPLEDDAPAYGYTTPGERSPVTRAETDANFLRGLTLTVATLKAAGKRVVLVDDVVTLRFNPQRTLRTEWMPVRHRLARLLGSPLPAVEAPATSQQLSLAQSDEVSALLARVAQAEQVELFDPRVPLRSGEGSLFFAGGHLLFEDTNHLSGAGAHFALSGFPALAR